MVSKKDGKSKHTTGMISNWNNNLPNGAQLCDIPQIYHLYNHTSHPAGIRGDNISKKD